MCDLCRRPFPQRSNRQRICVECRLAHGNRSVEELRVGDAAPGKGWKTIPCKGCGKDILSNGPKQCCPDCQLAAKRERLAKQVAAKRASEETTHRVVERINGSAPEGDSTCERCGRRFTKRDGSAGRFCSRACYENLEKGLPSVPRDPAAVVEARDEAVLRFLNRHDGVATHKALLAALPADDPATTPDAKALALKQALARLRFKGVIDRTSDTWSVVGIGTSVQHG